MNFTRILHEYNARMHSRISYGFYSKEYVELLLFHKLYFSVVSASSCHGGEVRILWWAWSHRGWRREKLHTIFMSRVVGVWPPCMCGHVRIRPHVLWLAALTPVPV